MLQLLQYLATAHTADDAAPDGSPRSCHTFRRSSIISHPSIITSSSKHHVQPRVHRPGRDVSQEVMGPILPVALRFVQIHFTCLALAETCTTWLMQRRR